MIVVTEAMTAKKTGLCEIACLDVSVLQQVAVSAN